VDDLKHASRAGDGKVDRVEAGVAIGVENRLAQRTGARIRCGNDDEDRRAMRASSGSMLLPRRWRREGKTDCTRDFIRGSWRFLFPAMTARRSTACFLPVPRWSVKMEPECAPLYRR
jgi:hypothetical protein